MKLTYWAARCLNDHPCYNVRARTKREAVALRAQYNGGGMSTQVDCANCLRIMRKK